MRKFDEAAVTKRMGGQRQAIDEEARTATFVFSSNSADRVGDIIDQQTWQLDRYKANPQFLWAHQSRGLPIGQTVEVGIKGGKLVGTVKFATAEENPFADTCWKLVKGGYLSAVSVGFKPHRYESYSDDAKGTHGYKFFDCELLECSLVPIPCNQDALMGSKAFGDLHTPFSDLLGKLEASDEDVFAKADLEAVVKALGAGTKGEPDMKLLDDNEGLPVYDESSELMGIMVGGALKMARTYQDKLRARNAVLIEKQASAVITTETTTEKKTVPVVGPNFFLKRVAVRSLARRTLLGM